MQCSLLSVSYVLATVSACILASYYTCRDVLWYFGRDVLWFFGCDVLWFFGRIHSCKMLLVQGLLLLCSLFAVGTCTCYSTNPQPPETCYQLFKEFESALTRNKLNLFNLEALFSPSLDTVPSLASITYVQYYNMSPEVELCPKSPDDKSSYIDINEANTAVLGWSNSGVYDAINPVTLHVLQPQSLILLMKVVNLVHKNSDLDSLLWDGTKPLGGVVLNLNLSLNCIPTEAQVNSSLAHTTSKVSYNTYPLTLTLDYYATPNIL